MSSLSFDFESQQTDSQFKPLAARMRPQTLEQYVGQSHLLAEGKALRLALEQGHGHSMILWGPPGTGKTTLAEMIAHCCNAKVERLSAVTSGIKDIRQAVTSAQLNRNQGYQTLLFVDEVHRFNKSQQDAFLPHIEDGTFLFVGATTENPSFELNNALLSRTRVYLLQKLQASDLVAVLARALAEDEILQALQVQISAASLAKLATLSDGDARRALNFLELLVDMVGKGVEITDTHIAQLAGNKMLALDKGGDLFYDLLSAFHKSIRGSDPDAGLYWFCRLLEGGADPLNIARRLLAIASEDVGNADPRAMQVAISAWDCYTRVGPAEGERAIAQAVVYIACAPKSNAVYTAFKAARVLARETGTEPVPDHLRNAPTNLMQNLGYGADYRYAHNEPGAFAAGEVYLPEALAGTQFYQPSDRGLEIKIQQKLQYHQSLNQKSSNKRYD